MEVSSANLTFNREISKNVVWKSEVTAELRRNLGVLKVTVWYSDRNGWKTFVLRWDIVCEMIFSNTLGYKAFWPPERRVW